jgi:hypothetical protein
LTVKRTTLRALKLPASTLRPSGLTSIPVAPAPDATVGTDAGDSGTSVPSAATENCEIVPGAVLLTT